MFNMDAANRASTIPVSTVETSFNTVNTSISGTFSDNGIFDSSTITPSYAFDGSDYIDLGTDSSLDIFGGAYSVSLWFNHTLSAGNAIPLLEIAGFGSTDRMAITLGFTSNTGVGFVVEQNTWNYNAGSGFNDGEWHNVIATRTGTTYKIYVDNIDTAFSVGSYGVGSNNRIAVGQPSQVYYNGNIGPIHIYNRVLSPTEILHNYNALKGRFE